MCIQMVSNDCKKLLLVYFYVNKPVVVGNCPYNGKKVKIHVSYGITFDI